MQTYPLQWPVGYKRTTSRYNSRFKQTMEAAQRFLHKEIDRLNGKDLIVSTNLPVRQDGYLYADWMKKKITDPGVAIYFKYKGNPVAMCCDKYAAVWENVFALAKGIEALRGMERWGVSDFLDKAFTGFAAIPETTNTASWFEILEVSPTARIIEIRQAFLTKAKIHHPDKGGNVEAFQQLEQAYRTGLAQHE